MATTPLTLPTGFEISPYGTFNWFDVAADDARVYNSDPIDDINNNIRYYQPIQTGGGGYQSDIGRFQLVSKWVPTCALYRHDNVHIKDVALTPIDPPILNVDFICYNAEIDFSDVTPGVDYYLRIQYTDDEDVLHQWQTTPLDAEIFHEGTQLFESTNFTNDKGVVFVKPDNTTLVFPFRVKSFIYLPIPETDATNYSDQYSELTQEESIPSVRVTQYLGGPELLPFWAVEKINLLYSLNQTLLDGKPFTKISGADFKPTDRAILPGGAFWTVDIQPNNNYPTEQFITGTPDNGGIVFVKMYKTYKNQSADFSVSAIFTAGVNLIRIAVVNHGGDVFVMSVGTSEGGNDLGTINFPDDGTDSIDIGRLFTVATTIYISGITGTNLDVTFDWNDYNALPVVTPPSTSKFSMNTLYWFEEVTANSFANEFDVASGLGKAGTDHEGCVLADGRNGVPNRIGQMIQAWNSLEVLPAATRGTTVGVLGNEIVILEQQMPEHSHLIANNDTTSNNLNPGGNDILAIQRNSSGAIANYLLAGSSTAQDRGKTSTVPATGTQAPIDVTNFAAILPAFYYVGV